MASIENPSDEQLTGFWNWFARNQEHYRVLEPGSSAWTELDDRLSSLGIDDWEIGPGVASERNFSLTLSPGGDKNKLARIRHAIALARPIRGWEFYSSKQPKKWNRHFLWSSDRVPVDASKWRFVVYRYSDGLFEIVLVDPTLSEFSPAERERIVSFVVQSEVGEAVVIEKICSVSVETFPSGTMTNDSVSISDLRKLFGVMR